MKAGTFNIHEYLNKLYENVEEENLTLNEEKAETENGSAEEGMIIPEEGKKAYDWLKREFQKGKTEVKVEMSSHTFKPGYELQDAPKSTKDFPGMYGQSKTSDSSGSTPKTAPFPETKFPGGETKSDFDNKKDDNESSENKKPSVKVEAKTKKEDKENKKDKEDEKE